jgi:uncharacterized SAM-binding protein YcdF (DUF218 family)
MKRFILISLIFFLSITMAWGIGLLYFVSTIPVKQSKVNAEYEIIIALTGGRERIPFALRLLKKQQGEYLFISGVADGFNIAEFERPLSDELKARIFYGDKARSTIGNANEVAAWLAKKTYMRVLVVTANYHLPRTQLLFNHYLADYSVDYAAVDPPDFMLNDWWNHLNSRRLILLEYHKWLATWIKLALNLPHTEFPLPID